MANEFTLEEESFRSVYKKEMYDEYQRNIYH